MPYAILTALLAGLIYFPSFWVRRVMKRHGQPRDDLPGTGGELAAHLLGRFELDAVTLEETDANNDHYDPRSKTVRLSPSNFHGKSLTAVAVAAHEVGHAIQFENAEAISQLRQRWLPLATTLKRIGIFIMMAMPFVAVIVRAPAALFAVAAISIVLQLFGALAYLIVLPEEWDASFRKAMPILIEGDYVSEQDQAAIESVLKAAALTYFASALAEILNLGRWLLVLRR